MKTKEAIEFLDHMANSFKCISSLNCKSIDNKKNDIVFLLEQGEKDRKILHKLKKMHDPVEFTDQRFMDLCDYIANLEEKS